MGAQKGIDLRAELVQRIAFNYEDLETALAWKNFPRMKLFPLAYLTCSFRQNRLYYPAIS